MIKELAPLDIQKLERCELVIQQGLQTFIEVGEALTIIRDSRLYRANYSTFEDYCSERWGMTRQTAYKMMQATDVVKNLNVAHGRQTPSSERQIRPLTNLEPEVQKIAWDEAVERHGENLTAAKVSEVANELRPTNEMVKQAKEGGIFNHSPISEAVQNGATIEEAVRQQYESNKKAHVSHNSGNNEWYTPQKFIESARLVMGEIDLDPATSDLANEVVQASNIYTAETDGINNPWFGRVWMNPPYAQPLMSNFAERFREAAEFGEIEQGIVLTNNATETAWFAELSSVGNAFCFPLKRIKFYTDEGVKATGLQGQCFTYFGPNVSDFARVFSKYGKILLPYG